MHRVASSILISSLVLSGCASSSEKIDAQYVSPLTYQTYNCNQIQQEIVRVSRRVHEVSGMQDKTAGNDAVAVGVGIVLFWPALLLISGNDRAAELGRLKGEYDAVERMAIQKECDVAIEIEQARRLKKERIEAKERSNHSDHGGQRSYGMHGGNELEFE